MPAGPCTVCGATNFELSFGGPSICPSCDCGVPPEVNKLRQELSRKSDLLTDYMLALQVALGTRFYMTDKMRERGQSVIDRHLEEAASKGFSPAQDALKAEDRSGT